MNCPSKKLKCLMVTSWGSACGIFTYSENLVEQLEKQGVEIEIFSETKNLNSLAKLARESLADVVHFQHEFGMSLPADAFFSVLSKFRSSGKAVVVTPHTEDDIFNIMIDGVADAVILHNDRKGLAKRSTFSRFYRIPHGIPEVTFRESRGDHRKKFGLPPDAFVIGTCGFVSPQRSQFFEELLAELATWVKDHKDVYIHLATSCHRLDPSGGMANMVRSNLTDMASNHDFADRFYMGTSFMERQEFRERLHAFTVGVAYSDPKIVSNSGAAADMISCGVPVVVNDAPHFSHIRNHCIVCPNDVHRMAEKIREIYGKGPEHWAELSEKALEVTKEFGYSQAAKKHIEIYTRASQESRGVCGYASPGSTHKSIRKLKKEQFVTITCPNRVWQILLLWRRLHALAEDGHAFRFVVQEDGMTDTSIFKYVLDKFQDIQYGDIGLADDLKIARLYSRSLGQNMTMDIERWVREGRKLREVFDFLECDWQTPYPMELGEYADRNARRIIPDGKDVLLINGVDGVAPFMQSASTLISGKYNKIVVMSSPLEEETGRTYFEKLQEVRRSLPLLNAELQFVVEDLRTRWALCRRAKLTVSPHSEVAVYCNLNALNVQVYTINDWQHKLYKELRDLVGGVDDGAAGRFVSRVYKKPAEKEFND